MASNPLQRLAEFGQSFWYDNIRRDILKNGELRRMVNEDGLRGVTSNPTIFEKAISGSADYDASIRSCLDLSAEEIFLELEIQDIRDAADILRPVYDATQGGDGFISIEVFPNLARDLPGTLKQARMLWQRVGRPNIMVKVPSTPECIPAIRTLLAEGININITLMFEFASYQAVVEAYLAALEERVAAGKPVDRLASVASLFVSRVDTRIDKKLEELARQHPDQAARLRELQGKAGITNARRIYRYFLDVFASERFQKLKQKGARVQRPLWASTSTKDPRYPDTMYVDALIAPDTVNTMPDVTIAAFRDHGTVTNALLPTLDQAQPVLDGLAAAGIDFEQELKALQDEGVEKFSASYEELIAGLRSKAAALRSERTDSMNVEASETLRAQWQSSLQQLEQRQAARAIWQNDATLWSTDAKVGEAIRNRLGWIPVVETMAQKAAEIQQFARDTWQAGFRHAVLLGMGGSSLAPEVIRHIFGVQPNGLNLHVVDTTDPVTIAHVEKQIDLAHTLFIVSSKSGGTIEPNCLMAWFWKLVEEKAPAGKTGSHFIAITDEGTSMHKLAQERGFRHIFVNPSDIGGRYSALSYFGLVPAALMGVDVAQLLERGNIMRRACGPDVPAGKNPGLQLGAALGAWAKAGRDKLTLLAGRELASFGMWLEQLIAESTGKLGKGIVPVDNEPLGPVGAYGADRVFARIELAGGETLDPAWTQALTASGAPLIRLTLDDRYDLAQEFFRWEFATAVAGAVLEINPFDEPNVKESKDNTNRVIQQFVESGSAAAGFDAAPVACEGDLSAYAPKAPSQPTVYAAVEELLRSAADGDYFATMAYFQETPAAVERLQQVRAQVRDRLRLATTLGFGPRFLHSTGQLHKGGANTGIFLQLTATPSVDREIPGQPYSFATLLAAQALGDYQSLEAHHRRLLRIDLGRDPVAGLDQLLRLVDEATAALTQGARA